MRTIGARREDGASAVEFALVVVPMFTILFGLIQYGLYFYSAQTGSNVANVAVRQLAVGNCQGAGALQSYVDTQLGAAKTASATITTTFTNPPVPPATTGTPATASTVGIGGNVTLEISFPTVNMHFPFVPFLSDPTITRTVQARVEDTTDQGCGS